MREYNLLWGLRLTKLMGLNRIISLGKLSRRLFTATHAIPHAANAGEVFYVVGIMLGIILWGFAILWFIVPLMMMAVSGKFPFNMGWWGFIFPVGELVVVVLLQRSMGLAVLITPYLDRRLHSSYNRNRRRIGVEILQGTFLCKLETPVPLIA